MTGTDRPQDAAHKGRIRLENLDSTPAAHSPAQEGATAFWADGTTSYVLHFRSGRTHGGALADETDTVIRAVDCLREGEDMTPGALRNALRDLRRLRTRLEAVEAELILYAREPGETGRPRLTFRDIGDELELSHSSVMERHARMVDDGYAPPWRNWLVQDTDRAATGGGIL
jgi:hypothetical protein